MAEHRQEMDHWLGAAKAGSAEALGRVLEACHGYLLAIAQQELDPALRAKGGASDLVQETFLKAHRHFDCFEGSSEEQLRAWLRRMLLNNLADFRRRYQEAAKRRSGREIVLNQLESVSTVAPEMATNEPSPSMQVSAQEQAELLRRTLDKLPDDYRQVLVLRYQQAESFETIAQRMNRSVNAVQKLWTRALIRLREEWETRT
jgi:RNA polymerase sigma-70 factor (ECF subfamily)